MAFMAEFGMLEPEAQHTAAFIENFDKLFDVFNSSSLSSPKPMRCAIKEGTEHIPFLKEMKVWLETLHPMHRDSLPCINGWKLNINSLLNYCQALAFA